MRRSADRILTTHVGSLPRPADLLAMGAARQRGETVDEAGYRARVKDAVAAIVKKQADLGIDVVSDGEMSKPSFITYINDRLGGFEVDSADRNQSPWAGSIARRVRSTRPSRTGIVIATIFGWRYPTWPQPGQTGYSRMSRETTRRSTAAPQSGQ